MAHAKGLLKEGGTQRCKLLEVLVDCAMTSLPASVEQRTWVLRAVYHIISSSHPRYKEVKRLLANAEREKKWSRQRIMDTIRRLQMEALPTLLEATPLCHKLNDMGAGPEVDPAYVAGCLRELTERASMN